MTLFGLKAVNCGLVCLSNRSGIFLSFFYLHVLLSVGL
jgi:hypothetical protein